MQNRTKDRLLNLGLACVYLCLPYSVPCIVINGVIYALDLGEVRSKDHSGDGFLSFVMGAPIAIPFLTFMKAKELIEAPGKRLHANLQTSVYDELVWKLESVGIKIEHRNDADYGLYIECGLRQDQEKTYADVVAMVAKQYPRLSLKELCKGLKPLHPLDARWAARHDFHDHAHNVGPDCDRCGNRCYDHWIFGREELEQFQKRERRTSTEIKLSDNEETSIVVPGVLCYDCRKQILAEHTAATGI